MEQRHGNTTSQKNPVYLGKMVQGKRMVTSFKTKNREFHPMDSWIIVENTKEPLVDEELWEAAQIRIRQNTQADTGEQ